MHTKLRSPITIEELQMSRKLPPITPGEILVEEFLKPLEISQARLARDIGVPPNRISQIINGKREITADSALRLGAYFNIEPEFWLNLQARYNLKLAKQHFGKQIAAQIKSLRPSSSQTRNVSESTHT